jgi:hypothetical protein
MSEVSIAAVADRLERRFGLGTRPDLRRALYKRLEQLCCEGSPQTTERAYQIIGRTASDASVKSDPAHYFARVVLLRLQEAGIVQMPDYDF